MFPDRQDLLDRGIVMREWEEKVEGVSAVSLTWDSLLTHWALIETDFQAFYGLDLTACRGKSFRWFQTRVVRLLGEDTALGRQVRNAD